LSNPEKALPVRIAWPDTRCGLQEGRSDFWNRGPIGLDMFF
jgi:hypothetical protein